MKKRGMGLFIAMGGIALVLIIASIFFIVSGGYNAKLVLVNDGFFVGEQVHDCLYATDESAVVTSIPAITASQSDIVYEKSGKFYVGNDYTPISPNYPYVINNGSAVMFTSGVDKLITGSFEYVDSYENLYMSGGVTYNTDMERAYREDFILVDAGNGLYMNADALTVGGSLTTAGEIPVHSFIRFMEDEIDYYYYSGDALLFNRIAPVSKVANISLGGFNYTYIEFLEKLGLYTERKVKEQISPTPTKAPEEEGEEEDSKERPEYNFSDPNYVAGDSEGDDTDEGLIRTSTSTDGGKSDEETDNVVPGEGEREEDEDRELITPDPQERPTRAPRPTNVPEPPAPADDPLPAEDVGERITPTPRPTATPLPTPTLIPFIEATSTGEDPMVPAPAAEAAPAAPAPAAAAPVPIPREYKDKPGRPVYYEEWKKPEVHLGDITTGTFTIFLDNFNIENAQFLYKRYGVQFFVKEGTDDSGKLVYSKTVLGSGALRLAQPFKPETTYTMKVVLNYINAYGDVMTEDIMDYGKATFTTKSRDYLDKLDLTYTKGEKESNSFILDDMYFGIVRDNPGNRFIESVEYLSRLEFVVTNAADSRDIREVTLTSSDLNKLRKGEFLKYESSRIFRANSEYNYVIHAYDRGGVRLLFANGTDEISGSFKTCTERPRATFRVQNNKIKDYTVAIRLSNSGNAGIQHTRFRIVDTTGQVVKTEVEYLTVPTSGAISFAIKEDDYEHYFPAALLDGIWDESAGAAGVDSNRYKEIAVKFTNLTDQCVYVLEVIADCDIYKFDASDFEDGIIPDDIKWREELLGQSKFTTASIASLGNLFLDNDIPATEENLSEGQLYMTLRLGERTNTQLLQLIENITIGFYKGIKDDEGNDTGRFEETPDQKAQISYVICDVTEDTDYMDVSSVIEGTRPPELSDWIRQSNEAAQAKYDSVLTDYYPTALNDTRNAYTEMSNVFDETTGENIPITYADRKAEADAAQLKLDNGEVGIGSEEYNNLVAIIDDFAMLNGMLESQALDVARAEAEREKKIEYDRVFGNLSNGQSTDVYIVNGQFSFGSAYGGDEKRIIDQLMTENDPATATGSAIGLKYSKELRIAVTGLDTNTQYQMKATAHASVGTSGHHSDVRTVLSRSTFRTYRKRAKMNLQAYYASSSFFTLFGLSIDDPDEAISEYPIELTVTNRAGDVMGSRKFNSISDTFEELRFNNLAREEEYTVRFVAKGYNRGWTKASSEIGKEIFVNDMTESLKIITHESIKADISLMSINDAYDLAPEVKVLVGSSGQQSGNITGKFSNQTTGTCNYWLTKGQLSIDKNYYIAGANQKINGAAVYVQQAVYTIKANLGDESYNIIEPGVYPTRNRYTHYQLFADAACTQPLSDANDPNAFVRIDAYDASTNAALSRNYWTSNYIRLNTYLTGEVTVYLKATPLNLDNPLGGKSTANSGVYMFSGLSFHKFGDKAYTANINAILKDEYGQLGSGSVSKYYVKVYEKEGEESAGTSGYHLISERIHEWRELLQSEDREHAGDNCLLDMYEYDPYDPEGHGTPLGQKTFVGGSKQIDTNFGVRVSTGKYYRLELWVKINNYSVRVGTVVFTSDRIIHAINDENDLYDAYCHPSESYIVTNDLVIDRANIFNTKLFNGVIDFDGHTVLHKANEYMIHTLGPYGEIRNLVYQKGDGLNNYKNLRGITYQNYGLISNIMVVYKNKIEPLGYYDEHGVWQWNEGRNSTNFRESQWIRGMITENNFPSGVVENFCVDLQEDMHFWYADGVALVVYTNYGMVRNGYTCTTTGAKIRQLAEWEEYKRVHANETTAKNYYTSSYYTGGIVRRNVNGIIESVYGLVDMELRNNDTNSIYRKGAIVCGLNEGYVRNSFSAAKVLTYRENDGQHRYEAKYGISPANLNFVEGNNVYGHSSNVYHYGCGLDYGKCVDYRGLAYDSNEIRKEILYDYHWYESLFDSADITKPGQWDYDIIDRGCYPHVLMDECMPAQPMISLPSITQTVNEIIPLAAIVTEQNDTEAYATITFYNPNSYLVNSIEIENLQTRIIQQWEEGRFYYVNVRLYNPLKYYDVYNLRSFRYSSRGSSSTYDKTLTANEYISVYASFYKLIRGVEDFATISYGLDENYKLANDIDFAGYDANVFAVSRRNSSGVIQADYNSDDNNYCFTGKFDGANHEIRNIDVGDVGFVFGKVAGPIKDLVVRNIHTMDQSIFGATKSTAKYMGLVATFRSGGSLDNVHVYGARFENITQFCGVLLARNYFENEITNCSVHDVYLSTGMPVDNSTAASVGGLVGHNDLGLIIHNCYIDNFEIHADQAGDVYGIGGMVGYTVNGIDLENVYAVRGQINTNYSNAGGLIGSVMSMNDVSTSSKSNYYTEEFFIRNYYTDVDIVTMADNVGGVIGYTSKLSGWDWNYGVVFGRIVSKSTSVDPATLGPVVGFYTGTSNADKKGIRLGKHQYVYDQYNMDGSPFVSHNTEETETSRLAYFNTISYDALTTTGSYAGKMTYGWEDALLRPRLAWKDKFEIDETSISNGIMPKLYYSYPDENGKLMLLPGQEDFSIQASELEVKDFSITGYYGDSFNDYPQLALTLSHDDSIMIVDDGSGIKGSGIEFDGATWNAPPTITTLTEDGKVVGTQIVGTLKLYTTITPTGVEEKVVQAKDKYFITAVNYKKSTVATMPAIQAVPAGKTVDKKKNVYLDLGFNEGWISIGSVADWEKLMSSSSFGTKGYNIYITADLDFGNVINGLKHNVIVNHFIGNKGGNGSPFNADGVYDTSRAVTIKGISLYECDTDGNTASFIEQATGRVAGITFEGCNIAQTYDAGVTKSKASNKTAVIGIVNGKIQDLKFKDVTLTAFASANMAPVGFIYNVSKGIEVEDINVIQFKRGSYYLSTYANRGGYVAFMGKFAGIDGLKARRVYIDAAGQCQGGVVGTQVGGTYIWDVDAEDIVSFSRLNSSGVPSSFVGGIIGNAKDRGTYQRAGKLHIENVFVSGHSYTGGIAGRAYIGGWNSDGYRRTTGTGVDGNISLYALDNGTTDSSIRSWVKNGLVMSYGGESVGGGVGLGGAWKMDVEDSVVLGGTYTGGVIGRYAAIDCRSKNVYVSRIHEKVGGESLERSDDIWPSMFFRPGGTNYKNEIDRNFVSNGVYKLDTQGTAPVTAKSYVGESGSSVTSHNNEQENGEGKYFDWKNAILRKIDNESDAALKTKKSSFWDEATWGMTSYKGDTFGTQEWQYGRQGKVREALGEALYATTEYNAAGNTIKNLHNTDRQIKFTYNESMYNPKTSTRYDYIGGVVGYATGARSLVAEDTYVFAPRSLYVGGIGGRVSAYDGNYTSFGGNYSFVVKNCDIVGGDNVGGAMGEIYRYNSQAILVDSQTVVEARRFTATGRTGSKVGGIAGRVYMGSSSVSEHPQFKYIVSAATVIGETSVGGLMGAYEQDFYTDTSDVGWLALGEVIVKGTQSSDRNNGDMIMNRTGSTINYVTAAALYDGSTLKVKKNPVVTSDSDDGITLRNVPQSETYYSQTASNYKSVQNDKVKQRLKLYTINQLKAANGTAYTDLGWPTQAGMTSSNYTTNRFRYEDVTSGFMPTLTMGGSTQNNAEWGMKDLYDWDRVKLALPGVSYGTGTGGGTGNGGLIDLSGMPQATLYTSGVDTISIDFSRIDPAYTWTVSIGGQIVSGVVDRKTISFTYDFVSDVTVVVSGEEGETVVASTGAELAHYVSAAGGSYNILAAEGIMRGSGSSTLPTRYGEFVNLYDGKALERDGSIIELETGVVTDKASRGTVTLDERTPEPLAKGEYGGYKIETFATYSVTTDLSSGESTVRDGFLFYTDGKSLQSIRTSQKVRPDSVILYSDLENTYFAALGSDRKLQVLLDEAFKVPEGISTEGIYEMSSSRELRAPYCIIRYANGGLCAFNFVTGEILYEQAASRGQASGGGDASSGSRAVSFAHAMELSDALRSGAVNVDGIVRRSPVSGEEITSTDAIEGPYLDGAGNAPDGTDIGTGERDAVNGTGTEVGEETVDGTPEPNAEDIVGSEDRSAGGGEGEKEELTTGTQPEDNGAGGTEDVGNGPSGKALIPAETGTPDGTEGEVPQTGEAPAGNVGGNTINGTNTVNGENGNTDGEVSVAQTGGANSTLGSEATKTSLTSVDPALLASVESEASALIEDGSLSLDTVIEALGTSESEARIKLFGAAAKIADEDGLSVRDAIAAAYKDIVLNPADYIEEPVIEHATFGLTEKEAARARDMEIIKNSLSGKGKIDPSTLSFVPVFNPETGEYELFEIEELLTGEDEAVKSIEERLAESGKFINTANSFRSGSEESKASRDYRGFIAVLFAIVLAGGLTWALIYKKRKEGSR